MKNSITIITLAAALLLAGGHPANAQRTADRTGGGFTRNTRAVPSYGPDPRTATNIGFEIITLNNIFNPTRVYIPPRSNPPPVIPTYSFTLTGVMTYGANDVGYGFFSGNAVSPTRGYMASDTINGYKISEITNNTVKLVDTNKNQEFILRVGAGFSRRGTTNDWRFISVPEPALSTTGLSSAGSSSDSGPSGPMSDVMRKLMARRAAEEGPAAGADAGASPDGGAPADGAAPPADSSTNSPANSNPTPAPAN
jgi:hypothetical protein